MILVRGSPFGPMMPVRDEMHRLFHGTFGQVRGDGATGVTGIREPPVNIYETMCVYLTASRLSVLLLAERGNSRHLRTAKSRGDST
jgi:hypothetical protein